MDFLREHGVLSEPSSVVALLKAMAGGTDAIQNRHDTILIAAAQMIEVFERDKAKHIADEVARSWGQFR